MDETASPSLATNQPARVLFRSEPAVTFAGTVARLGREADRETREFVVDVRVEKLPRNWTIGQRAEVFIETGRRTGVVTVPSSFVHWRGGRPSVVVNDHGRARWRDIAVGLRDSDQVEVVQGLTAGEVAVKPLPGRKEPLDEGQRLIAR